MDYLAQIRSEGDALLAAVRDDLDVAVPSCPGWDTRRLVSHVGRVLTLATLNVPRGTTTPPDRPPSPPKETDELIAYYERAVDDVIDTLARVDPATPAWNFTLAPPTAAFWPRRMAAELLVHRWDACLAAGRSWTVDPLAAADAVDEVLTVLLPAARAAGVAKGKREGLAHVHLTDTDGEWLVDLRGERAEVSHAHGKGDVALRGPAGQVVLTLWGRVSLDDPSIDVLGDTDLVESLMPGR